MNSDSLKSLNLKEVYELIDLYKYASIEGERVEFSVVPTSDNKRIISIELQNDFPRDKDTFVFEDGDYFDKEVYPRMFSYFMLGDSIDKSFISLPGEEENKPYKYELDTKDGNAVILDTYKETLFEELGNKVSEIRSNEKIEKTNEDAIWDEVLLYAKDRRMMLDFYKGSGFNEEEIRRLYNFIAYLADKVDGINIGTTKKAKEKNEKTLTALFNDNKELLNQAGLSDDLINKVINNSAIGKLAILVGAERRLRKRVDISNDSIKNKIEFATGELEKVNFYSLRNASTSQFKNQNFISSKPKAIKDLVDIISNNNSFDEDTKKQYESYCYELLEYLERKSKNVKKEVKEKFNIDEVIFVDHVEGKEEKKEFPDRNEVDANEEKIEEKVEQQQKSEEDKLQGLLKQFDDYMHEKENETKKVEQPVESKDVLFEIVQKDKEEKVPEDYLAITEAYEKALSYSTGDTPANIKVVFEKGNKEEATVYISNKVKGQDVMTYQKTYSIDELNGYVMKLLRELYSRDNELYYDIKFNVAGTKDACLLLIGVDHKTFNIANATDEFVDENKEQVEQLINKVDIKKK